MGREEGGGFRMGNTCIPVSKKKKKKKRTCLPMQGTQEAGVRSLGQEDLLEKGMATHSSILA